MPSKPESETADYPESMQVLELWSNDDGTEHALSLSDENLFRACTNAKAVYSLLVDAVPYFEDMQYNDWKFTLLHWVMQLKRNSLAPGYEPAS